MLREERVTDPDRKTNNFGLVNGWTRAKIIEVTDGEAHEDEQAVKERVE